MPKLKSNRGAAKRFTRTASGQYKRVRAFHNHILTKKDAKRKRRLRTDTLVASEDTGMLKRMLPYR